MIKIIKGILDNDNIEAALEYGYAYFIFSSVPGMQEKLFSELDNKSFINSYFDSAIKIPKYIASNKITDRKISELKLRFTLPFLELDDIGIYNQLIFIVLNELITKDAVIVETTGLAKDSIKYLITLSLEFLKHNPSKMIVIIENEYIGVRYPKFRISKLGNEELTNFDEWHREQCID